MIDSCEACYQVWLHRGTLGKILTDTNPEPVDPASDALANLTLDSRLPEQVKLVAAALNRLSGQADQVHRRLGIRLGDLDPF
jgi:hypothetical protein